MPGDIPRPSASGAKWQHKKLPIMVIRFVATGRGQTAVRTISLCCYMTVPLHFKKLPPLGARNCHYRSLHAPCISLRSCWPGIGRNGNTLMSKKSAGDDSNDASESTEATLTALTTNISEFVLNGTLDTRFAAKLVKRLKKEADEPPRESWRLVGLS
jgi:hypothetical protein